MICSPGVRDPHGSAEQYAQFFLDFEAFGSAHWPLDETKSPATRRRLRLEMAKRHQQHLVHRYASGAPLDALRAELDAGLPVITRELELVRAHGTGDDAASLAIGTLDGANGDHYGFAALALLLGVEGERLREFTGLLLPAAANQADYLLHLLVRAFAPHYPGPCGYRSDPLVLPWTEPVLRAVALAQDKQGAALAAHMQHWYRLRCPEDYYTSRTLQSGSGTPACAFAFEVALAVCAYDVDDRSFAGHPYYPNDLVLHYRRHVRCRRDAWRRAGAGAGVPVPALPTPQ